MFVVLVAATPRPAHGQESLARASRESITDALRRADSAAGTRQEGRDAAARRAAALQQRLREGDFQVGDRILIAVAGMPAFSDTFVVRTGRTLQLPDLPPLDLTGVLRAELQPRVATHVARVLRDPIVTVTPLTRVAVLGAVMRPGFFALRTDVSVSDAIMLAGGPTGTASLSRTVVRRGDRELWSSGRLRAAVQAGNTLEELDLRSGDEIVVGEARRRSWPAVVSTLAALGGLAVALVSIAQN